MLLTLLLLPPPLLPLLPFLPTLTDSLTSASINTVSDLLAQTSSSRKEASLEPLILTPFAIRFAIRFAHRRVHRAPPPPTLPNYDIPRTLNYLRFGIFDGAISHLWFVTLDSFVGTDPSSISQLFAKVTLDAILYTPLWCVWFLLYMSATTPPSPSPPSTSPTSTPLSSWLELYKGNLGFFLPLTTLIYRYIPIECRVLAFGIASLVYTTVLSAWNAEREEAISGFDGLCELHTEDEGVEGGSGECIDIGVPTRSPVGRFGPRLGVRLRYGRMSISNFDLDEFLDRPFFEPEKVKDGSPFKWFADLVVNDYERAESIYIGGVFFVLVAVGQEWLRRELNGGG